jgi:DNA invertase Pin-like site-specific DNA recombinase
MKTAALYIRVSTEDQTEYSPDAQKRLLTDYANKNGMSVSNEFIFIDDGISGKKADKRPQFQHMIGLAKSKEHPIDVILVWKYSRFARNQEESIVYKSLLKKNNVDVISITEPLIDGPFGTLIERIIEWMDEYYSIRLSEEVKKGMTEKAMRGEYQTYAPFGYTMKKGEGQLKIDENKSDTVRLIFDMYLNQSKSFFYIARHLNDMGLKSSRGNKFEHRTVKYIIQNPVYKGWVRWNPSGQVDIRYQKDTREDTILKQGEHEPIIDESIWDAANEKMVKEYRPLNSKPREVMVHWLSGIIVCSNCGGSLVSGGSAGGFQCTSYSKGKCKISHYVSYTKIEKAVINALQGISISGNFDYEIINSTTVNDDAIIENALLRLDQKAKRMKDAYLNGVDSLEEYKENKIKFELERQDLIGRMSVKDTVLKSSDTDQIMIERISTALSIITSDADRDKKSIAIRSIIQKIIYNKSNENIDVYLYLA